MRRWRRLVAGGVCAPDSSPQYRFLDGHAFIWESAWKRQLPSSRYLSDKGLTKYKNSQLMLKLDLSFTICFLRREYAYSVRMSLWDLVFEMASLIPQSP